MATVQNIENTQRFSVGIYHSGLGESLLHNGKDLFSFSSSNGKLQIKEKPWLFFFENTPLKLWGDLQSEIITNLYTFDSETALRSSLTLLLEYRVASTGFPIVHWTTMSSADNKVILNWRIPLLFADIAVSLFFDSHGVEMCLIFCGDVLFIGNAEGLTQAIDWKAFGAITAFGSIHVVGEKCFFLSAYHSGGIHGNEIDLREGTVAVSPLEGASLYSSVTLPIVRQFHSIVSQNWKQSAFETFAIIGDPFVGFSFIYTDSFASRVSPEYLAAISRIFDCPSYGQGLSLTTFQSLMFHSRHALFLEEEEVLQTVRSVHPLRLTGSYIIDGMPLADFQLVSMENIPSLCSQSNDMLFVLTSRSFSCSSLLRFNDQGNGFEVVPGILVENDATLAVYKLSDRRVLQITSHQVQCFTINAAKQWVLETKFDVCFSGKQQLTSNFPSKILQVARYRDVLWLVCDAQCLAKLEICKLPTIEVRFTTWSSSSNKQQTEISAISSIRVPISKTNTFNASTHLPSSTEDWLATAFWESSQIQIQRGISSSSKAENEVTGTLSLPVFRSSSSSTSNHITIHQLQFLFIPNRGYLLLALSQSDGYFLLYAFNYADYGQLSSNIQVVLLVSYVLDAHTSEISLLNDEYLLVRTITKQYYEVRFHWEVTPSLALKRHETSNNMAVKDLSFPDSASLFTILQPEMDCVPLKLSCTIRPFGDLSCRNVIPFLPATNSNRICSFVALSSPELLSTGKSHREMFLQQPKQQQSLLQQLLVIQGEIDLSTQCYQSLAVSERFMKINDVLLDSFSQQLLVLHWVPPTNHHIESVAKEEENEVTMVQQIDVLDSISLEPLRHLTFETASFSSVSKEKTSFSIWTEATRRLLGEVGIVSSLSAAPTNRYIRDTSLMTRHLQRIDFHSHLQQQSLSADSHNKRRGSKNNDHVTPVQSMSLTNTNENNAKHEMEKHFLTDLRHLALVIVETVKRCKKNEQSQSQSNKKENDAEKSDSEEDNSDSDYDPPEPSPPPLNTETTADAATAAVDSVQNDDDDNNNRRKRKKSLYNDSHYDSRLHVMSFLYSASDTLTTHYSTFSHSTALSAAASGTDTGHSNSNMQKLNLIPLDCTQWSLPHYDLLRHPPLCASITTKGNQVHNNDNNDNSSPLLLSNTADEHLAILTIDGTLSIVGWMVSLLPRQDSPHKDQSARDNRQKTLDDLAKEPLRKGEVILQRLTHMQSSLQPMIPPKYEVDYSDVHRTMETLGKLEEERSWRKSAKPQLICQENIAVVYVPRVGFELYRLVTTLQQDKKQVVDNEDVIFSAFELELCAVIKDTIDFERLFVLTQSNVLGDVVVKIFGHDRMMTRSGREDRAMRLHSFTLSADVRYSAASNATAGATAVRRDMFSPLPRRTSSYTAASFSINPVTMSNTADKLGIHTIQLGTFMSHQTRSSMAFVDFVDCMDAEQLLQMCTVVDDTGEIEWAKQTSSPSLFVENL